MTKAIATCVSMMLAAPVLAAGPSAGSFTTPTVTLPAPMTVRPQYQALPQSTTPSSGPPPAITVLKPVGCIPKGSTIYLQGNYFLASTGRGIALSGGGAHVDLSINSWSDVSIAATVPNDSRLQEGASYFVAMEKSDHSQWLSNTDKSITICAAQPAAASDAASDSTDTSGGDTSRPAISDGGSLLGGGLPPPPAQTARSSTLKEDVTVEPGEVMVVSANMNEAQQLQQTAQSMGLGIKRRTPLGNLGLVVSVFRVPKGTTVADALGQLRQAMPNAWLDANHRYQLQAGDEARYAARAIAWTPHTGCGAGLNVGLIDTAIDTEHPLFKGRKIVQRVFLASGIAVAPKDHGTATASILVGGAPTGLMPDAQLHAAVVFRLRNKKEIDTTAEWVVNALDWLVGEKVAVINMSLGGPRNLLVEAAVQRVLERGIAVVAAAGNGGADGAPVYPAAQSGVIAVTAIDANLKPYERATRGDYISYAAPGVDVWVATPGGNGAYATGTSYAAPFVTAIIAAEKWSDPKRNGAVLDRLLQSKAKDLGAPGRDKIFGWGLIQMPGECARTARKVAGKTKSR